MMYALILFYMQSKLLSKPLHVSLQLHVPKAVRHVLHLQTLPIWGWAVLHPLQGTARCCESVPGLYPADHVGCPCRAAYRRLFCHSPSQD